MGATRETIEVETPKEALVDITTRVQQAVARAGLTEGLCTVFVPHTTAGVTINENADPDVCHDVLLSLRQIVQNLTGFRHGEGNSTAHVKASLLGSSVTVLVRDGRLALGTWQGIYFAEFDGPRRRQVWIDVR